LVRRARFSISAANSLPNWAGVHWSGRQPMSARPAGIIGSAKGALISALSRAIPAGAPRRCRSLRLPRIRHRLGVTPRSGRGPNSDFRLPLFGPFDAVPTKREMSKVGLL
jgi:hypothetical protein